MSTPLDIIRERLGAGEPLSKEEAVDVDRVLLEAASYDASGTIGGPLSLAIRKLHQPNRVHRTARLKAIADELAAMLPEQRGEQLRKDLIAAVHLIRHLSGSQ